MTKAKAVCAMLEQVMYRVSVSTEQGEANDRGSVPCAKRVGGWIH